MNFMLSNYYYYFFTFPPLLLLPVKIKGYAAVLQNRVKRQNIKKKESNSNLYELCCFFLFLHFCERLFLGVS